MQQNLEYKKCPRCCAAGLKTWNELTLEEKILAEKMPFSAEFSLSDRKQRHLFCSRCWFETAQTRVEV
jgi:Zn-finger nucleic acid-binding protein